MHLIIYLQESPLLFIIVAGLFGLVVGSFLNVVIYRLPVMLEREWRAQCDALAENGDIQTDTTKKIADPFNLAVPRSTCPSCGHIIKAWENIPIISYLLLRAKCSKCDAHISCRYPIIEGITALLSVIVAWHFGFTWQTGAALLLTWALICLTMIDFDHYLLPDNITLPFLWAGLLLALFGIFTHPADAIIGAILGYMILWSIYWVFKLLTGKEGMGYGDFKLLALLGAWMGWQALPVIILLSSLVGAIVGISLIAFRNHDKSKPIPFGPYLAAAGWICLIWGNDITNIYMRWVGLA